MNDTISSQAEAIMEVQKMTKAEAIKLINERMCFGRGKWSEHHVPEIDDYWKAGNMAIKALKQPEQPQWIPCSERYPDMDERVLVYTVAHDYHVWDCMSNRADNYFWEDEDGLYHDKYEADLWMPLPETYKKE